MSKQQKSNGADENGEMDSPRTEEEISTAIGALIDKVWYNRCHLVMRETVAAGTETLDPEIWASPLRAGKQVEERYPVDELGPYSDFDWGMINGKLSALRWVLGEDWDQLDT
jgi:hypothetical protein